MRTTAMSGDTFAEVNSNRSGSRYTHDSVISDTDATSHTHYIGFNITNSYITRMYLLSFYQHYH